MSVQSPADKLLAWYDDHARVLPWRAPPGAPPTDAYRVWLSEVMLQQTTVATVSGYFARFLERWPDVAALAAAPIEAVLQAWAGLGYYARARNLHACAVAVARDHGGRFPDTEEGLRALPGIGAYTAAAIAAIAFGRRAVVVDGNVERVVARLHRLETPLPAARPVLRDHTDALTPDRRPGDFAQAMMDLGATVCTPRAPRCDVCPLATDCAARASGTPERWPVKAAKVARPTRLGVAYWLEAEDQLWLRRRPPRGLLGGLPEIPSSDWQDGLDIAAAVASAPVAADWRVLPGRVVHVFTHFRLELAVATARLDRRINLAEGFWHPLAAVETVGLPTALAKVVDHVQAARRRLL